MLKIHTICIVAALILSGCNFPLSEKPVPSATPDIVATQVHELLTVMPTATNPPVPTQTPAGAKATETATAQPTLTALPSATIPPKATATVNPGDPAAALGKPVWKDTLDSAKNFYLYENDNTKIESSGGALVLTSKTAIGWHGWTLTYAQNVDNFYVEGVFKTGNCSGADLYGLIFRASKESAGYFFGVTCDGKYNLYARDFTNNVMTEIKPFAANAAILQGAGQTNRLGVLANGDKISLYANGVLLGDISDGTYTKGFFGPFIAGNVTENFSYQLEEISLWNIQ